MRVAATSRMRGTWGHHRPGVDTHPQSSGHDFVVDRARLRPMPSLVPAPQWEYALALPQALRLFARNARQTADTLRSALPVEWDVLLLDGEGREADIGTHVTVVAPDGTVSDGVADYAAWVIVDYLWRTFVALRMACVHAAG